MRLSGTIPRRGFTLIEALVAMLIVAVGLLALAATQLKLARSADVARQRGEATRLADEKLEQLRSYTAITSAAGVLAWNDLASASDNISTNATYTRSWTVAGSSADPMRRASVAVSWTDRTGEAQSVTLTSVVSKTDPADVGSLGFPLPANTTLKRPKNRNLNIPVPAVDLGNGQSVVQMQGNFAVVFSNDSGYVVKTCNFVVSTAADLASCTTTAAYIVAGYLSLDGTNTFPAGLAINTAALTGNTGVTCSLANAVDQTSGAAISGYEYYLCVISVATAGAPWSGTVRLAGLPSATDYLVCRFQYPAAAGITANQRNVQPYTNVVGSLDSQNYVLSTASTCPTIGPLATTLHQNCRSDAPNRGTQCPSS